MKIFKRLKACLSFFRPYTHQDNRITWSTKDTTRGLCEACLQYQWGRSIKRLSLGFSLGREVDETVAVYFSIPWICLFQFSFYCNSPKWLPSNARETGIIINHHGMYVYLWHRQNPLPHQRHKGFYRFRWRKIFYGKETAKRILYYGVPTGYVCRIQHDIPPFANNPTGIEASVFKVEVQYWEKRYSRLWMYFHRPRFSKMIVSTDIQVYAPSINDPNGFPRLHRLRDASYDIGGLQPQPEPAVEQYCQELEKHLVLKVEL